MQKYPLAWPNGWPRTEPYQRKRGTFRRFKNEISVADGVTRVLRELRALGVQEADAVISTNLKTRLDGFPRSDQANPADPGVAVYWQRITDHGEGARKVLAVDAYDLPEHNLAAIAATLEAMRAIERHGGARILERAFTGFTALPAPGNTSSSWRHVLGLPPDCGRMTEAEAAWKRLRSQFHPDKPDTGDQDRYVAVNKAWEMARIELGNPA